MYNNNILHTIIIASQTIDYRGIESENENTHHNYIIVYKT